MIIARFLRVTTYLAASIFNLSVPLSAQDIPITVPGIPITPDFGSTDAEFPDIGVAELSKKIINEIGYNAIRVKVYVDNPIQFIGDRALLEGDKDTLAAVISYQNREITARELIKLLPSFKIGANISIKGGEISAGTNVRTEVLYNLMTDDGVKASLRDRILRNPGAMFGVADRIRQLHFDIAGKNDQGQPLSSALEEASNYISLSERFNSSNPDAVPYETFITQNPDFAAVYTALQLGKFNDSQLDILFSQETPAEERLEVYLDVTGLSYSSFQSQYLGTMERLIPSLVGPELVEAVQSGIDNEVFFANFNSDIADSRTQFAAFVSVLNIIDPVAAEKLSTFGLGVLKFTEGIGNLFDSTLTDTESAAAIGSMATGYTMIIVAMKQSEKQAEMARWKAMFQNQKIMLDYLKLIDRRVDIVDQKVDRLLFITTVGFNDLFQAIDKLHTDLLVTHLAIVDNARKELLREQQRELFENIALEQSLLESIHRDITNSDREAELREEIQKCWQPLNCTGVAAELRNQYRSVQSNRLAYVREGFSQLETFVNYQNFRKFDKINVADYLRRSVENRLGLLSSIAEYISVEIEKIETVKLAVDKIYEADPVLIEASAKLAVPISHPKYLSEILTDYVDNFLFYPPTKSASYDIDVLRGAKADIENLADGARHLLPFAVRIYQNNAIDYLNAVRQQIVERNSIMPAFILKPSAVQDGPFYLSGFAMPDSHYGVLLGHMTNTEVIEYIDSLNGYELASFTEVSEVAKVNSVPTVLHRHIKYRYRGFRGYAQDIYNSLNSRDKIRQRESQAELDRAHDEIFSDPIISLAYSLTCEFNKFGYFDKVIEIFINGTDTVWSLSEAKNVLDLVGGARSNLIFSRTMKARCDEGGPVHVGDFFYDEMKSGSDPQQDRNFRAQIADYISKQHNQILKDALESPAVTKEFLELQKARLALDTVIRAGYGECVDQYQLRSAFRKEKKPTVAELMPMPGLNIIVPTKSYGQDAVDIVTSIYQELVEIELFTIADLIFDIGENGMGDNTPVHRLLEQVQTLQVPLNELKDHSQNVHERILDMPAMEPFEIEPRYECSKGFSHIDDMHHVLRMGEYYLPSSN